MSDPDCIFCKIVAGELPSTRIREDERTVAFMDINPATRGHALVVPREHARDIRTIDPGEMAACATAAQEVAGWAIERLGADGVNVINSSGVVAGQTVFHFHLHVLPRYRDDGLRLPLLPAPGGAEQIEAAAAAYTGAS